MAGVRRALSPRLRLVVGAVGIGSGAWTRVVARGIWLPKGRGLDREPRRAGATGRMVGRGEGAAMVPGG